MSDDEPGASGSKPHAAAAPAAATASASCVVRPVLRVKRRRSHGPAAEELRVEASPATKRQKTAEEAETSKGAEASNITLTFTLAATTGSGARVSASLPKERPRATPGGNRRAAAPGAAAETPTGSARERSRREGRRAATDAR